MPDQSACPLSFAGSKASGHAFSNPHIVPACSYLYKSTSPGVQDYLCNRLYSLPEAGIERYLSQLCQLVIHKPHSPLEKVLADLCARSLRIAVKVS